MKKAPFGAVFGVFGLLYARNASEVTCGGFYGKIDTIGDVVVVSGWKVGKLRQNEVEVVARLAELHRLYFVRIGENSRPLVSAGGEAHHINIAAAIVEDVTAHAVALDVV